MTTPDDSARVTGEPVPPRWDAPPQPPAWDRPVDPHGWGPPPQHPPSAHGYGPVPVQTDGKAVAALVLAISSWVLLPFVAAVVALLLAGSSKRAIAASGGRLGGTGLITASRWIAWLNIGLCVLGVLLVVAAFVLFASVGFS